MDPEWGPSEVLGIGQGVLADGPSAACTHSEARGGGDGKAPGSVQMLDYFSQHVPSALHAPCDSRHAKVPTIN